MGCYVDPILLRKKHMVLQPMFLLISNGKCCRQAKQ